MASFSRTWVVAPALFLLTCLYPAWIQAQSLDALQKCVVGAASHYQVDVQLIKAIVTQEGGIVGKVSWNRNGSYDIGPMQINSSWLKELSRFGITETMLQFDGCLNVYIGAWMLKRELVKTSDVWRAIGNYHSHSLALNAQYQWQIWRRLQQIRARTIQSSI